MIVVARLRKLKLELYVGDFMALAAHYWHVGLIGLALLGFSVHFVARFIVPSFELKKELESSIAALKAMRTDSESDLVDLELVAKSAMSGVTLNHLWREYTKTLHPQKQDDGLGQSRVMRWRSTALAETFFTEQAIVESRLKTEFFKHLPGVLTGLGIIGTFSGLILGLIHFKVSTDVAETSAKLGELVTSVGHAFYVSAAAITLAMLFTWIEKAIVAARYRQTEELREQIDSLFESGAGEEYLERLVLSSENAATQSAQIKDALVADLKIILTTLTTQQMEAQSALAARQIETQQALAAQQMEAQSRNVAQMSTDISQGVARSLEGPMNEIKNAVTGLSGGQGEAINELLKKVLGDFTVQIREIFGKEISSLTDRMTDASSSMEATATEFAKLAANMNNAGTQTVDAMGTRLGEILESIDGRQKAMNDQMTTFVQEIKGVVDSTQSSSTMAVETMLVEVAKQMNTVVDALQTQAKEAADVHGRQQTELGKATKEATDSLSEQMAALLRQSTETNQALKVTVQDLTKATTSAVSGLNTGAQTLQTAATDFARAGDGVSRTMQASAEATEHIKASANHLAQATDGAKVVFSDYARTRDTFTSMVQALEKTIENASRDASMTSEFVNRIQGAAEQLKSAQIESENYLKGVTDVLVSAHEEFRKNLTSTLQEGNSQFQIELSGAVHSLSSGIKNLADVLEEFSVPA